MNAAIRAGVNVAVQSIQSGLNSLLEVQNLLDVEPTEEVVVHSEIPDDTSMRSKREWADEFKKMADSYVMAKKDKRDYLLRLRAMVDRAIQDLETASKLE